MTVWFKTSAALLCVLLGATGCKRERTVEMSFESVPRDGQVVQNDFIEMREGQAMAVRVVAVEKGERQPQWTVEARSRNSAFLRVQEKSSLPTDHDEGEPDGEVFVISAPRAGDTEIKFILDGEFEVIVDAQIASRGDWKPTVPEAHFGGAGPE